VNTGVRDVGGAVSGELWFTVAGNPVVFDSPQPFDGRYKLNGNNAFKDATGNTWYRPIGGMSFQLIGFKPPFIWDYSFIMVSKFEAQIITGVSVR
jgi:hypothetical protein